MLPHYPWLMQAAAILTNSEVNVLLGAMAWLWGTIVVMTGLLYKIGAYWVSTVNAEIEAIKADLAKVPVWISAALGDHEQKDQVRHQQQLEAIRKNADAMTIPLTIVQAKVEALTERLAAVEDTSPRRRSK